MRIERFLHDTGVGASRPHPLLALGFRPFFLAAALMAALWLPLWLAIHLGGLALPLAADPIAWHAHELIFGFAAAVLAGFLLTAARNWTRRPTPSGGALLALVLVWLAGRVVMLVGHALPPVVVALVDVAFLPLVALALARPLIAARNRRNYAFPVLLLVLAAVNVLFHAGDPALATSAMNASVAMITVFLVVMGGRVIPFFTRNACPDARVRTHPALDWSAALTTFALVPAQALSASPTLIQSLALAAGVSNLVRVLGWDTRKTLGNPLLWVLHLGYAFIGIGLTLQGLALLSPALTGSAPTHALTVGALGALTLGMMARVSLGHTARPLVAPRAIAVAFVVLAISALLRVVWPLVAPTRPEPALWLSGLGFAVAFATFVVVFLPILTRPRVDGAPG